MGNRFIGEQGTVIHSEGALGEGMRSWTNFPACAVVSNRAVA